MRSLAASAAVDAGQAHKLLRQFADAGLCGAIASSPYPTYRAARGEELSLRLHQAAAERLRQDPKALKRARQTLERWISRHGPDAPRTLLEWREILAKPLPRIIEVALDRTQFGDRIRKSSPLSTLVSRDERRKAYAPR